jgi:hypothetical protein
MAALARIRSWLGTIVCPRPNPPGWLLRANAPGDPGIVAILISFVAVGLASLGGFLGGELVVRLGVGVAEGAHLNAPSSLSGRPVGRSSTGTRREQ